MIGSHQRQRRFQIEDHLFYIKLRLKDERTESPLLVDILEALQEGFDYILKNLRQFYNASDHNMAYMTFFQEPMINGINTGGFDINENSVEMIQRLLQMLNQFLISNQSLKVNETFKVYVKVLSVNHLRYKATQKPKKKYKRKVKHYGSKRNSSTEKYNFYWAIDVPYGNEKYVDVFKDKCLLTTTIIGIAQNDFFKSNRKNKNFLYLQNLNSPYKNKQNCAIQILLAELSDLLAKTNITENGPYELEETVNKLHKFYKCQFFIFDALDNSSKLNYMFPAEYDDTLIPIYLYQPIENSNHLLFIKNLNSYFKRNLKVCFTCKKTFRNYKYRHICCKKKVCFACRRYFMSDTTYSHEKLKPNFCDKNIANEKETHCLKCNVTIYSNHCAKGHRVFCYGIGSFGWKCLKCNKFTYRFGKENSNILKIQHNCDVKHCKWCHEKIIEENHLCKLKKEHYPSSDPQLAFIGLEHSNSYEGKCTKCFNLKLN